MAEPLDVYALIQSRRNCVLSDYEIATDLAIDIEEARELAERAVREGLIGRIGRHYRRRIKSIDDRRER